MKHTYLHVPIDNREAVQISEREDDFSSVKPRPRLAERAALLQMREQLSAVCKLHHETQMVCCLETIRQLLKHTTTNCYAHGDDDPVEAATQPRTTRPFDV